MRTINLLFAIVFFIALTLNTQVVQAGLMAYWTFDNTVADTTGDVSPDGVLEQSAGFSTDFSPFGGSHSLDLNPTNSRFRVTNQAAVTLGDGTDFSYSVWIKPNNTSTETTGRIIDTRGTSSAAVHKGFISPRIDQSGTGWKLGDGYLDYGTSGFFLSPSSPSTVYTDTWHHLAGVYNATTDQIQFFVNGSPASSLISTAAAANFDGGKDLTLGAEIYHNSVLINPVTARTQKYSGLLDELAIFDEPLTGAQISQLYAGTLVPSNFLPAVVPEPSSFLLLGLGALGLVRHTRRQRRRA